MTCPIPRSGKFGFVADTSSGFARVARVKNWSFNITAFPNQRVYAGTRFGTQRVPCFFDYVGSFEGFGAIPPYFPGDEFSFLGYTAPTTGVVCAPGCAVSMDSLVLSTSITWNWTAGNCMVDWVVNFGGIAAPTFSTAYDPPDGCIDDQYCDYNPCLLTMTMLDPCDQDAEVEWCNWETATLNFVAGELQYSNNSTVCQIRRQVANLDWTLDIVDQNPCIIPTLGADYIFRLGAALSTYWELKYGHCTNISNWRTDIETGAIITKTNSFAMQAVLCCPPSPDLTPTLGSITHPDTTVLWPYSTPIS